MGSEMCIRDRHESSAGRTSTKLVPAYTIGHMAVLATFHGSSLDFHDFHGMRAVPVELPRNSSQPTLFDKWLLSPTFMEVAFTSTTSMEWEQCRSNFHETRPSLHYLTNGCSRQLSWKEVAFTTTTSME